MWPFRKRRPAAPAPAEPQFVPLPAGGDFVQASYKDGSHHKAHAFKIDWNHPGLIGFIVLEKDWRSC